MGQSVNDLLALMHHVDKHKLRLGKQAKNHALKVIDDRVSSEGPYRSTPMEDYVFTMLWEDLRDALGGCDCDDDSDDECFCEEWLRP